MNFKDFLLLLVLTASVNVSLAGNSDLNDRFGSDDDDPTDQNLDTFFEIEILRWLGENSTCSNYVLSPRNLKVNLGLLSLGTGGNTARELREGLRLPLDHDQATAYLKSISNVDYDGQGVKVKMANQLLTAQDINVKAGYKRLVRDNFPLSSVRSTSFSSPQSLSREINQWVNTATNGLIQQLVDESSFDASARMVLLSAVYFKGEWKNKFDPKVTALDCFYRTTGVCEKTPMMIGTGVYKYKEVPSLDARILELPYTDGLHSMVIVLPNAPEGLWRIISYASYTPLYRVLKSMREVEARVKMPKFSIEYNFEAVPFLQRARVNELFTDDGNFSLMIEGQGRAKVSNIVHKAIIKVNERGTVAAAATGTFVVPLMSQQREDFVVDRPFLFFIKNEKTGFIFEGTFCKPDGADDQQKSPRPSQESDIYKFNQPQYPRATRPPSSYVYSGQYPPPPRRRPSTPTNSELFLTD